MLFPSEFPGAGTSVGECLDRILKYCQHPPRQLLHQRWRPTNDTDAYTGPARTCDRNRGVAWRRIGNVVQEAVHRPRAMNQQRVVTRSQRQSAVTSAAPNERTLMAMRQIPMESLMLK